MSIARSIAPDDIAPAAIPMPEPNIAADAELCAAVRRYAFSLNVVTSIPNHPGSQLNVPPAYAFFDAYGVVELFAKKFTVYTQSRLR